MGGLLHLLRGVNILVPRNLHKRLDFTIRLQGDEPAIVVESLNGYRLKEDEPTNLGNCTVPVGKLKY